MNPFEIAKQALALKPRGEGGFSAHNASVSPLQPEPQANYAALSKCGQTDSDVHDLLEFSKNSSPEA